MKEGINMNLPITTWQAALFWLLTSFLLGFGWYAGGWLAGKIFR